MTFAPVFDRFIKKSPISVMLRGTLENVFAADKMNALFRENAVRQVDGKLAFSTCADLMALVVTTIRPSVNAAYVAESERFSVSVQSVYNKLSGIEPEVSEALVRQTADDLREVLAALAALPPGRCRDSTCASLTETTWPAPSIGCWSCVVWEPLLCPDIRS